MSTAKIITGVAVGTIVGAALGILFAPDKGTKTRSKILRQKDEFKDMVEQRVNQFVDELTEQYETAKSKAATAIDTTKKAAASTKAEANHHSLS